MPQKRKSNEKTKQKGFRLDTSIVERLESVSSKTNLSEAWFVNDALRKQMPEYEQMAEQSQ